MPALLGGTGIIGKDIFVKMKAQKSASIQTASGTVVTFPQSAERAFSGLSIYGHSTQSGTPSPDNPVPIVSAGSVMTTGKNVLPPELGAEVHMNIPAGTKCFLVTDGTPSKGGNILLYDAEGNVYYLPIDAGDTENVGGSYGVTYKVDIVRFANRLVRGVNTAMYIGEKLPYEPYTGGVPGVNPYEGEINVSVSDGGTQSQTLTLSTPGGLPGIPVTSGGNYTDADGQQWVCDEIDLARGKYVQRVKSVTFDGSENWGIKSSDKGNQYFSCDSKKPDYAENSPNMNGLSNMVKVVSYDIIDIHGDNNVISWIFYWRLRLSNLDISAGATVDDLKQFLSSNPITVYYTAQSPIETDLTAEEIAAYKALHTYSPTTTVSNDAEAWMKVGYNEFSKQTF